MIDIGNIVFLSNSSQDARRWHVIGLRKYPGWLLDSKEETMDKGFLTVIPQDIMDKAGEIGLGLVLQAVGHTVCVHLSCTWFWSN